jgi:pimeloyl-ACP methyl ester carboxylesterase
MFTLGLTLFLLVPAVVLLLWVVLSVYLYCFQVRKIVRIFREKPLFIIPRGQPTEGAEDIRFPTSDGLTLCGCYLKGTAPARKGVVLFGLEFGSNRWACVAYTEELRKAGYDVFAFESRNQGDSDALPDYEPLQWLTEYEVEDTKAALAYLKSRPDADPRGVGFFGISKGGAAGLFLACQDPSIRCCVTDGAFGTYSMVVPYMRLWYRIYDQRWIIQAILPTWYFGFFALIGLRWIEKESHCRFPHLEDVLGRLAPRPWLMIHGAQDTYVKPVMTQLLFDCARQPKELWMVEDARHNQALQVAGAEYERRVREFFDQHLGKG